MLWGLVILMLVAAALLVLLASAYVAWRLAHPPRRTAGNLIAHGLPADPGEIGLEYEPMRLEAADGAALALWDVAGSDAAGPAIIVLHGWGDSRAGAQGWLEVLTPLASHVVLYDHRGHGESAANCCTWGACEADDATHVAQWLRERHQRPVVLFGYSMGAVVAITVAARRPGLIAGVIADSPFVSPAAVIGRTLSMQGLPGGLLARPAWWMLTCRWRSLRTMNVLEAAGELRCPLLVLHGDQDRITPPQDAEQIAAAAPEAKLIAFAGSDHLGAAFEHPEAYLAALRQFFDRCDAEAAQ